MIAASVSAAPPASAQAANVQVPADTLPLSIVDVQRLALRQNPVLLGAREETRVAEGALRQARILPFNPELALQSVRGNTAGSGAAQELVLSQDIEWAGQRGLRVAAGQQGWVRTVADVRDVERGTMALASASFYRTLAAGYRVAVAREAVALTDRLVAAVRVQLAEGEISTMEANLAEIEAGRARARVLTAERVEESAALELRSQLGIAPHQPIRVVADTPGDGWSTAALLASRPELSEDSLVARALAQRPDLAATAAAVREGETLTRLARRSAFPTLRIGAAIERAPGDGSLAIGPAIGLSLPLFNRSQGLVDQRRAQAARAVLEHRATELRVRSEVFEAVRAYRRAAAEEALFDSAVVRPARENATLLEVGYLAGKIPLPTLLLLSNQLLDAEFARWDAWLSRREAAIRLDAAIGTLAPWSSPERTIGQQDPDRASPTLDSPRNNR